MVNWPRPVPRVGDPTSAAQRAADPGGWAFAPEQRRGPLRDHGRPPGHPAVPAGWDRSRHPRADPGGGSRRPVGGTLTALALRGGDRGHDTRASGIDGRPGAPPPGVRAGGGRRAPDARPPVGRNSRGPDRTGGLLRPTGSRRGGARPGHLCRCRPLVVRLRHREPVAGGPGRGARHRLGHPLPTRRAGIVVGVARRCGDFGLAVPRLAGRTPARARARAGRLVAAAAPRRRGHPRALAVGWTGGAALETTGAGAVGGGVGSGPE